MKGKLKKYRVVRKSKFGKSNSLKLRSAEMNQSLSAKSFLDNFKIAFPDRCVEVRDRGDEALNEAEAYNAISERTKFSQEKIRALIEGPLRKYFSFGHQCCAGYPQNPVFIIVCLNAKSPRSKMKIHAKSNVQNSNDKTEMQRAQSLKSFLENIDGPCCDRIPIKHPMSSIREGVASVLCICPIHKKAWREGTG
jgi:hypothetical protein